MVQALEPFDRILRNGQGISAQMRIQEAGLLEMEESQRLMQALFSGGYLP
jgi:hypothetical protein